ncbi:hypothetical protein ACFOYW_04500 [Gryllotalpicola reticulitermitis]|uniref:GIY-YIG domain-containing protein n=1 Tax=Gryllotalpicola reticulitermitis TaxID=1184153 RepID=A0ABV8Q5J5_9MICO
MMIGHFGLRLRDNTALGLRLSRDTYATINKRSSLVIPRESQSPTTWERMSRFYADDAHTIYTDAWCEEHRSAALRNFDRNMAFFDALDEGEFNVAVDDLVATERGLVEVHDLNDFGSASGFYMMVLDGYKQAYFGVTGSELAKRMRQHWTRNFPFDRLLWGNEFTSIIAVDSFRALDTTRLFATRSADPFAIEERVVEKFPSIFRLNRLTGGRVPNNVSLRQVVSMMKIRDLSNAIAEE